MLIGLAVSAMIKGRFGVVRVIQAEGLGQSRRIYSSGKTNSQPVVYCKSKPPRLDKISSMLRITTLRPGLQPLVLCTMYISKMRMTVGTHPLQSVYLPLDGS